MGWRACRGSTIALSALIVDLDQRGLLDAPWLYVWENLAALRASTRKVQTRRQHWPSCYSAILAGGGIRGGMVYGESDKLGAYVKDKPVRPQDLGATIYHALGVPLDTRVGDGYFHRAAISSGQPILKLFG